jgi:phospholipid transport system substrate-binding protein
MVIQCKERHFPGLMAQGFRVEYLMKTIPANRSTAALMRTIVCCLSLMAIGLAVAAHAQAPGGAAAPPAGTAAPAANTMGPQELVENSAKRMLAELDKNRPIYAKDSAKLDSLVANVLLPNFDSEYSAKLVLGQSWRTATPEQRKRFVDAFYHSLLRNYGNALLNFTADRFVILPYKGDPADTTATVRTEVKKSSGENVPVNFSLRKTEAGWKAWDVVIEGISYVKSFRTDIGAEIQQKSLDEVINRLETEGKVRGAAPGTGA